jgi:hypothetical protein
MRVTRHNILIYEYLCVCLCYSSLARGVTSKTNSIKPILVLDLCLCVELVVNRNHGVFNTLPQYIDVIILRVISGTPWHSSHKKYSTSARRKYEWRWKKKNIIFIYHICVHLICSYTSSREHISLLLLPPSPFITKASSHITPSHDL